MTTNNLRILIIDDNPEIHKDFSKILISSFSKNNKLSEIERELFDEKNNKNLLPNFKIDSAFQGEEGVELIAKAKNENNPYAVAFVDIRMPPGYDGIETIKRIWKIDNDIQIVICTAYSDYTWEETVDELGQKDNLFILKKPFDSSAVRQLAMALSKKWQLLFDIRQQVKDLERRLSDRASVNEVQIKDTVRQKIESDFHRAIEKNEFFICYQPQYDIKEKKLASAEALVRWMHPNEGLKQPDDFVPLIEANGLGSALCEWVLKTVCLQNQKWQASGLPKVRIAINISAREIVKSDFILLVQKILKSTSLQPCYLEIELTENVIINSQIAINTIKQLKKLGVLIAIDDFGTGFSSLDYLRKISVNRLKIDQSFVKNIGKNKEDEVIIESIIAMAKKLNIKIVAEGVETKEHFEFLKLAQCDEVQGFYLGTPLSTDEFEDLLQNPKYIFNLLKDN